MAIVPDNQHSELVHIISWRQIAFEHWRPRCRLIANVHAAPTHKVYGGTDHPSYRLAHVRGASYERVENTWIPRFIILVLTYDKSHQTAQDAGGSLHGSP